jgi:hypothetical protein
MPLNKNDVHLMEYTPAILLSTAKDLFCLRSKFSKGKGVVYATYTRHVLYLTAHNGIKGLPQRMGIRAHRLGCWRPCQQLRPFNPQ